MEHLRHFQLSDDPFRSDPLEKLDVSLPSQERAQARLERAVRQGRGLLLLTGPAGVGKTRVARWLFETLEEEVFEASMLMLLRRSVDSDWILPRLARQLGVEAPEQNREALVGQIHERLAIVHEDGRRTVLIIDDAHALADPATLSEVCALVKLEYEDQRLLSLVLVGAEPLDGLLADDPLLAHSVDVRVAMESLSREETSTFLEGRLAVAAGRPDLLLPGAVAALHELARGAPGRLNTLADNALFETWLARRDQVTRNDVERAAEELGWGSGRGEADGSEGPTELAATAQAAPDAGSLPSPAGAGEGHTQLMDFERVGPQEGAEPSLPSVAEPTRVAFAEETLPEPPPKEDVDSEVDDLFMELLDD